MNASLRGGLAPRLAPTLASTLPPNLVPIRTTTKTRGLDLADCDLLCRIGSGGMGEVHLATVPGREGRRQAVALKRLLPELVPHADMVQRFVDEARLAACLRGPHLVPALEISRAADQHFYTMEFVDGTTLAQALREATKRSTPMPLGAALWVAVSIAEALDVLHGTDGADGRPLQAVHCDVSPTNVLLTEQGDVRLVDVGLARGRHATASPLHEGRVLGTLAYMSPEQCQAELVTRRSDIFSLGVLLWEMTCNRRLFRGVEPEDVLERVLRGPIVRPSELDPCYPSHLEQVVLRALCRRAAGRFPDARSLADALRRFAERHGVELGPTALSKWLVHRDGPEAGVAGSLS